MARLFGTDGVRGLANRDITADLALHLSVAAARTLGDKGAFGGQRSVAVVGRDPRASGEFLGAAVCAGLASAGVDVLDQPVAALMSACRCASRFTTGRQKWCGRMPPAKSALRLSRR